MQDKQQRFEELMQAYLGNRLTRDEYAEFWAMMNDDGEKKTFANELTGLWEKTEYEQFVIPANKWDAKMLLIKESLQSGNSRMAPIKTITAICRSKWAVAAVLLAAVTFGIYLFFNNRKEGGSTGKNNNGTITKNDKAPGENRAFLTLADGTRILLDSISDGTLAIQGNTNIIKQHDGQLIYDAAGGTKKGTIYNTLTTPRGGQYKITLSDGTRAWLNASSWLRYPASFTGSERKVEISGEAYFEVAKDPSHPFKVSLAPRSYGSGDDMEIEVIGTHFNINGYDNEDAVRTTLLEGRVKVNTTGRATYLIPGQQAQLNKTGEIKITDNTDLEETVAWKDGNFQFDNSSITSVMHQLERWYDMETVYAGTITKHFSGTIPRNVNLSKVLELLQRTGEVKFSISGNKIIVQP